MTLHLVGDRRRFALGFELVEDPDPGPWLLRRSWGRLSIWVAGHSLTLGCTRSGELLDGAEIPLLPVLEWLAERWDPLLHEERLPRPSRALSAASWRVDVLARLPGSPAELDELLNEREAYWRRHGLGSALSGFRVPDLHLRRRGDQIELSWDDREWRTVPTGVLLAERPGHADLPCMEVAEVLRNFAEALLDALEQGAGEVPEAATQIAALRRKFAAHQSEDRHVQRLKWMTGVNIDAAAHRLRAMAGVTGGSLQDTARVLLGLDAARPPALVTQATLPALLFRSASPRLSADDLHVLIRLAHDSQGPTSRRLNELRTPAPIPGTASAITSDGLERALELREALHLPADAALTGESDLESKLLPGLAVEVKEVHLDDEGVDGIAIAGPGIAPTIAINLTSVRARAPWGRRMILAHELCHLLFDVDEHGRVGVVSNVWADAGAERRANAFAVMLLAPEQAIGRVLARDAARWTRADLATAMAHLGVGKRTFLWQLQNLGWIDASSQDRWLDVFDEP